MRPRSIPGNNTRGKSCPSCSGGPAEWTPRAGKRSRTGCTDRLVGCKWRWTVDWHSRRVLAWRLSNTMDTAFCVEALAEAIRRYGAPEIFNTDQGSPFTSEAFTGLLKQHRIRISMDGKGRALDNIFVERLWRSVKYEEVYPRQYQSLRAAHAGLAAYFRFYNTERPHQSLANQTPADVYDNSQPLQRAA